MFIASQQAVPYRLHKLTQEQRQVLVSSENADFKHISEEAYRLMKIELCEGNDWEDSEEEEDETKEVFRLIQERRRNQLKNLYKQRAEDEETCSSSHTSRKQYKRERMVEERGDSRSKSHLQQIKQWKSHAAQGKKELTGSVASLLPINHSKKTPKLTKFVIDRHKLMDLYTMKLTHEQQQLVSYEAQPNEDPFYLQVFEEIFSCRAAAQLFSLRESQRTKMRTLVVRRALESFVAEQIKNFPELFRDEFGLGAAESIYRRLGIEDPPSRMRREYMQDLFQVEGFVHFYSHYLKTQQLSDFLHENNRDTMHRFMQFLLATSKKPFSLPQKIKMLKSYKRRPLYPTQIDEYLKQADVVLLQYGTQYPKSSKTSVRIERLAQ